MYIYIERKLAQLCGRLSADVFFFFFFSCPLSASCKVNAGPWVRIINECGQCLCRLCRVLHHPVYFHIRDTFLLSCDSDCHASFVTEGGSFLCLRHTCSGQMYIWNTINLCWECFSPESGVIKWEPFTGLVAAGRDFFKCTQKGPTLRSRLFRALQPRQSRWERPTREWSGIATIWVERFPWASAT